MIIHICGASGSGKTTLGNKIKEIYGNKIIVKDLDDLFCEFLRDYGIKFGGKVNINDYQEYIYKFIDEINGKNHFLKEVKPIKNVRPNRGFVSYKLNNSNDIKLNSPPLIFVGLNLDMHHNEDYYYDTKPDYKFYIDAPINKVIKTKM